MNTQLIRCKKNRQSIGGMPGCVFFACLLLLSAAVCRAQSRVPQGGVPQSPAPLAQPATSPINNPATSVLIDPSEDYRILPGDTIEIQIEDALELSGAWRISAAGKFEMPFLGVISAQGKTTVELARGIADSLRQQDYLRRPQVKIFVRQFSNQSFFIQGAVRSPGVYQVEGKPSLVKLISLAGGLVENHGPTAFILRPIKKPAKNETEQTVTADSTQNPPAGHSGPTGDNNDQFELIKVSLTPIYEQGRSDQNVRVEPGDIVNIPQAKVFFVAGEVHAPGSFQLKEGTTLRQAISLAQGTNFKAALDSGVIFRDDPGTGKRQEIRVDIGAVMNGKKEDVVIYPNDVIIVPNSRVKSVSSALLTAFGLSVARLPMRY